MTDDKSNPCPSDNGATNESKVYITDECTGQTTIVTGDPNVKSASGQSFNVQNTLNFTLKDGTTVQLQTELTNGHHEISGVVVQNSFGYADVQGVDNYLKPGGTASLTATTGTGTSSDFQSGQHSIYLTQDGGWSFSQGGLDFSYVSDLTTQTTGIYNGNRNYHYNDLYYNGEVW